MDYLRNDQMSGNKPQKKYQNPEDVFRKESRNEFKKNYPNIGSAQEAQREAWAAMSDNQKEKYVKLYEDSLKEYENNLAQFNGGSSQKQIPPKPKHGLNPYFIYLKEQREDYVKQHPDLQAGEISQGLSKMYNSLTEEQKLPYKLEAKRQQEVQNKEIEKWEELYGEQFKEEQKKLKEQQKYSAKKSKKDLTYQEILSHKKKRNLVPLGDEETKQTEERGRGRPRKLSTQREENQRESDRPSSEKLKQEQGRPRQQKPQEENHRRSISRSPLEIVKSDQKDQKVQGKGRPKRQSE